MSLIQSSPKLISSRKHNRSRDNSPTSRYPPNSHTIVLVSHSHALAEELSDVITQVEISPSSLLLQSDLKAIIFDAPMIQQVHLPDFRKAFPTAFIALLNPEAAENPAIRSQYFDEGVNMVAHDIASLLRTIRLAVVPAGANGGSCTCPYCSLHNLTEEELWYHCPTFHINWPNEVKIDDRCPICREAVVGPMQVHIHEQHNPRNRRRALSFSHRIEEANLQSKITQLYNFSLVICRHPVTKKYLLCQEFANQGFWCPGGAVDPGESMKLAAIRETMEEAGIEIELKGILGIEYNPCGQHWKTGNNLVRMRIIFYAEPSANQGMLQLPKSCPDFESAGACWCTYDEIQASIKLRGSEPRKWTKYIEEGNAIYPLSLLSEKQ